MFAQTLQLGPAARFVPLVVIALTLGLLAVEGVRQLSRLARGDGGSSGSPWLETREVRALAWIVTVVVLIAIAGAAAGSAAIMLAYLRLEARTSWVVSTLCGAAAYLGIELLRRSLGVPLPTPLAMV